MILALDFFFLSGGAKLKAHKTTLKNFSRFGHTRIDFSCEIPRRAFHWFSRCYHWIDQRELNFCCFALKIDFSFSLAINSKTNTHLHELRAFFSTFFFSIILFHNLEDSIEWNFCLGKTFFSFSPLVMNLKNKNSRKFDRNLVPSTSSQLKDFSFR